MRGKLAYSGQRFEFLSAAGGLVFGHLNNVIPAKAGIQFYLFRN
jgi:hypothetical protein